ncbi:MAG: hemolysin family protein [Clostridia bacterium]|nr:hemolysin family protein [Clostridia bacterium]
MQLILIVILILINAFFAASEVAIITINDKKLKKLADDGNSKASLLMKLIAQPSSFLAAVQVGVTLAGLLASAVASESFSDLFTKAFAGTGLSPSLVKVIAVIVITLLLSYFTLVFGELVPKRIAMQNSEAIALRVARMLHIISTVFKPFVSFLALSTNTVVRMLGIDPNASRKSITEEEILMMVDVGEESGVIEENEKEMINNVFEFNDRTAGEVMTHRTDIVAVETTATIEEIVKTGISEGYSRIPVFEEDLDNIIGIIMLKDLIKYVGVDFGDEFDIRKLMRPPLFIPETKRCDELFGEFCKQKQHMAVVVDEYGGTAGIVTMEDIVESIFGDIQDEYDHEEEDYSIINENTFTIEGVAEIEDISRLLGVDLPQGDYDTVGGLVLDLLGRIPAEDEHPSVSVEGITFTVEQMEDRRIEKLLAVKDIIPGPSETEQP